MSFPKTRHCSNFDEQQQLHLCLDPIHLFLPLLLSCFPLSLDLGSDGAKFVRKSVVFRQPNETISVQFLGLFNQVRVSLSYDNKPLPFGTTKVFFFFVCTLLLTMPIPTFHTLKRQKESQEPSSQSAHYPKLASLPLPHIESFNAIFNHGVGNPGLMEYAVNELGRVVVFDKSGGSIASGAAKKIECKARKR